MTISDLVLLNLCPENRILPTLRSSNHPSKTTSLSTWALSGSFLLFSVYNRGVVPEIAVSHVLLEVSLFL